MQMREILIDDKTPRLNVVQWGKEDSPAIVLLHGLRSAAKTWAAVAHMLAKNYRVIAPDQRGRGKSDWDPEHRYFTRYYVDDLKRIVDALKLDRFILLGHSMGGTNALTFTHHYRAHINALIIEDIGPATAQPSAGSMRIQRQLSDTPQYFKSRTEGVATLSAVRPDASAQAIEERAEAMLKQLDDGRWTWRYDLLGITEARCSPEHHTQANLWPMVESITVPTLLIRGAQSDVLSEDVYDMMLSRNQTIQGTVIDNASHFVHEDNFDGFMQVLTDFLERWG